nr:hypothetical protein [Eubacterium sp.]
MKKATIRLNGSAYINDMELDERYKVTNDGLWISVLSLVGNPDGVTVTPQEDMPPALALNLGKNYEKQLEEKPTQYLVLDLCYTASHALLKWKDQVFTKNPRFVASKFYQEHESEMELLDVLHDASVDWKPYMDAYIQLISKYYDKDHIILVKSRCPKWFVTHTHVRPLLKKDRVIYNKRIKVMEDYFVEKVDPYVVDIYSHYFAKYKEKKGFQMSFYEKPFYHHAKRLISTIIRTKPEQRVFSDAEYFMRLGRFINYYNNLFARERTHLLMNDAEFLDHLVLQMGRPVLAEFETDLVEIQKRGYGSIEEILEKYNFKFAESLKACLKVVQAVEAGVLFAEDVDYSFIKTYKMKIVESFAELVREEVEAKNWISGEVYVNRFNCMEYYNLLMAERAGAASVAKKQLFAIDEEMKNLWRQSKKQSASVYERCAIAMNTYYKPIRVDIWGSGITKEMLTEDKGRFVIGKYVYRNCFLFAFDEPIPYPEEKFEDLTLFRKKQWNMEYVRDALKKDLPEQLDKTGSEWLLIDFFDLVCGVMQYKGGTFTADVHTQRFKFFKEIEKECTPYAISDLLSDDEMKQRIGTFVEYIKKRYGKNIIFIRAHVKTEYLNFRRNLKPIRGQKESTLLTKRKFLNKWQNYFEKQLDCYVIDYAKRYHADDLYVTGASMVNLEKEFYEKGYEAMYKIMYEGKKKKRYGRKEGKNES